VINDCMLRLGVDILHTCIIPSELDEDVYLPIFVYGQVEDSEWPY
jgi:hypothetical protein